MTRFLDPGEGRHLYGSDPVRYALGRPEYPERVYEVLATRCGLATNNRVVEIGPGTGIVTRRLLNIGSWVTAVEPNDAMASYLRRTVTDSRLEVVEKPFEGCAFPAGYFDLAVAATSFHWVDERRGMAELRRILRPKGWVAIWWMLFEDPTAPDALSTLVADLVGRPPGSEVAGATPFQLDDTARRTALEEAGFSQVDSEVVESTIQLDGAKARALYGSMAVVLRRTHEEQDRVLDAVEAMVRNRFNDDLHRRVITAIYIGRNP